MSSQAEQLQSTISFFKIAAVAGAPATRRDAGGRQIAMSHHLNASRPDSKQKAISGTASRHGVVLHLDQTSERGSRDSRDEEFEKF